MGTNASDIIEQWYNDNGVDCPEWCTKRFGRGKCYVGEKCKDGEGCNADMRRLKCGVTVNGVVYHEGKNEEDQ